MRVMACGFSVAFLLVACSPDAPSQTDANTGAPMTAAKPSSSLANSPSLAPSLTGPNQSNEVTASNGFDGLASLWSRVTGKEQDAPNEPASSTPPIKITPAAEVVNPFPTLRVVQPGLADKLAAVAPVVPLRMGDQLEKRTLEKRPGDMVGRRAGDLP